MQQKLMSYQIFTEIFRSANRESSSTAGEPLSSPKPTSEIARPFSQMARTNGQGYNLPANDLSLTASEIKSEHNICHDASVQLESKDYALMEPEQGRWKKSSVEGQDVLQQVLRECHRQEENNPISTVKQLRELLAAREKTIGELIQSRQELQSAVRNYKHQLSTKQKQYETFREIISNLEEDIMEFRSEIKKSQLQAKETSEKHAKEVQTYQQQLSELKQTIKEARVKNTLIIKDKDAEIQSKDAQLSESIDTNSRLLDELIVLRKDKDIRKEQVDKQHQLIIQYEKRNEQTNREVTRLTDELLQLRQEFSKQGGIASLGSTTLVKNCSKSMAASKVTTHFNSSSASRGKRSTSIPTKRCQTNIKAKLFGLRKELAELKQELQSQQESLGQYTMEMVQNIVGTMQAMHNEHITERNEQLEALRKEMIKLKVEVFELQLKQQSARQSATCQSNNRHSDGFWMAKLLESTNGLESVKASHTNRNNVLGRETVINNSGCTSTSKRSSARKIAKEYDSQRKATQDTSAPAAGQKH